MSIKRLFLLLLSSLSISIPSIAFSLDRSEEIRQYMEVLASTSLIRKEKAASEIADFSGITDAKLFNFMENQLLEKYTAKRTIPINIITIDAWKRDRVISYNRWLIRALVSSGDQRYVKTLELVADKAGKDNVRATAEQFIPRIEEFKQYNQQFEANSKNNPNLSVLELKIKTLIESDIFEHKRRAVNFISSNNIKDEKALEILYKELEANYLIKSDKQYIKLFSKICVILGRSGNLKYKPLLEKIAGLSNSKKLYGTLAKRAKNSLIDLEYPLIEIRNVSEGVQTDAIIKTIQGDNEKSKLKTLRNIYESVGYNDPKLFSFLNRHIKQKIQKSNSEQYNPKELYWLIMALSASGNHDYQPTLKQAIDYASKLKNKRIKKASENIMENLNATAEIHKLKASPKIDPSFTENVDLYYKMLSQDSSTLKSKASRAAYNDRIINNKLSDLAFKELSTNYKNTKDESLITAMAYICKLLGHHGDSKYKPLIKKLATHNSKLANDRKLPVRKRKMPSGTRSIAKAIDRNAEKALTWME